MDIKELKEMAMVRGVSLMEIIEEETEDFDDPCMAKCTKCGPECPHHAALKAKGVTPVFIEFN